MLQEGSTSDNDVALQGILVPGGTICGLTFTPEISIINLGSNTLTSLEIDYDIDGNPADPYTWTGSLNSGQSTTVSLPETTVSSGLHFFGVSLSNPNGNTDEEPSNNDGSQVFNAVETTGSPLPVENGFNGPFPGGDWSIQNPDEDVTWEQDLIGNDVNCSSGYTASIDFYTYGEQGETDDIETPWTDLGSSDAAELTFDYAYARYSSFYFDRMQVQIKTACDDNWITLWDKENLDLATAGSQTAPYTPSCGDWSSETIDLSDYSGVVKVRFRGITGWGNNLYLDNIMLSSTAEPDCNGVPGGDAVPGSDCTTDSG
ncbi:MAG: hypothetical protein LC664_16210, partial [Flavobacteriales bacterium]|nr:hypothetical protein [Flavobacteriales bacterium]